MYSVPYDVVEPGQAMPDTFDPVRIDKVIDQLQEWRDGAVGSVLGEDTNSESSNEQTPTD